MASCPVQVTAVDQAEDLYRIGSVAQLTGIAVERLRAWERRYGVAPAHRVGRTRFYSDEQVRWLKSVKALIDNGQPISSLVGLSQLQLDSRLTPARPALPAALRSARVALVGSNLLLLEQESSTRLQVVSRSANIDGFLAGWDRGDGGQLAPEVVVLQVPVLQKTLLDQVQDVVAEAQLLVLYEFATEPQRSAADAAFELLKWPAPFAEIERRVVQTTGLELRSEAAAERHFSDEELVAIAGSQRDETGCPRHLSRLISDLNAFAAYTESLFESDRARGLERRGPQAVTAGDNGSRYRRIHAETTQARALLERSLESLIEDDYLSK